ncbi:MULTISPECIES: class I SAM-dependent methyltransferase [Ruminococcus]|uniref:Methyltransferase domain-containing protein n=1 Tax=Ruminococcus bovis TaxID=2564099 RepID=A0A4P8XWX1_9FIRM|nr:MULTISPECIES: class I SAM-dependent methyltransferase [Ruminococcus]MEE3439740.1 methyltransferase domain-containing protein [Ruminococcus sp.]QCT06500.1 methyltransferase domain-containing protein [Ruminococcus bovis]
MEWNSSLYDNKHDFVAEYGKGLLEFVPKNKSQSILDLGCGTGTLTYQLAELCNKVVGVDSSENMINKAKCHYPNIDFMVCDALDLPFENEFDVVFSNAVFHWISDHNKLAENIYKVLRSKGLLVCEFGGSGNVATVEKSFQQASKEFNCQYKLKFNFPTVEEFGNVLSENGFVIDNIYDFDRPTVLKDKEQGLSNWMKQFYADELAEMPTEVQKKVLERTSSIAKEKLWNGKEWVADYRRLRVIAHKN